MKKPKTEWTDEEIRAVFNGGNHSCFLCGFLMNYKTKGALNDNLVIYTKLLGIRIDIECCPSFKDKQEAIDWFRGAAELGLLDD